MNSLKNCSVAYKVGGRSNITLSLSKLLIVLLLFGVILTSCGSGEYSRAAYEEKSKEVADSVSLYMGELATDTINGISHNFIRKANVKCKVKDVLACTQQIEYITNMAGGYVTKSELISSKDYCNSIHFKKDSVMDLTYYTTTSDLAIRVPNMYLDTVLSQITHMALFVDHRNISSDDVKLKLYANKLAENRYKQYKDRVQNRIDKKDAKLNQVTSAEENVLEKQTLADNKRIESYDLADQVNYSTVMISLYEKQKTLLDVNVLPATITPYEPSFFIKLGNSFMNGLNILEKLLLFIINLWGVFVLLFVLYFITKKIVIYFTAKTSSGSNSI